MMRNLAMRPRKEKARMLNRRILLGRPLLTTRGIMSILPA